MGNHVLIVDDQREVSRLLRSALETIEQGLIVSEAPSGEEAILEAALSKIDLLIADYRLPGITGVELMKKFRARNPEIKVILVSGVSDPRQLKEMNDAGADAFFAKPVPMADFLAAVERLLGMARTVLNASESEQSKQQEEKVETAPVQQRKNVADLLVGLRKDFDCQAVVLLNDMGNVQAEAGELPDPKNAGSLLAALMSMLSASQKVASLLDRSETQLHLFSSDNVGGVFTPLSSSHSLLLVGKKELADAQLLAGKLPVLSSARQEILQALKGIGIAVQMEQKPAQRSAIDEPFTRPEDLPREFMAIFTKIGKEPVDANAFWDTAVEKGTTFAEPDKLTWEQASKLGLTPDAQKE